MQPINYSLDVANPFQAALQGFQTGAGIQQVQQTQQDQMLKRQQEQQAMQAQQAEQARVSAIQQKYANFKGAMTPMNAIEFASIFPAPMVTALKDQFAALGGEAGKKELGNMAGLLSSLRTNPEVAQNLIQQKIDAATNSGNTEEAASFKSLQDIAKTDPIKAYNALTPLIAALGKEGQDMLASVSGLEETQAKTAESVAKTQESIVKTESDIRNRLAPAIKEALDYENLTPTQQKTFQSLQILKKPPAAVTNVNVSNVDKTAAAELGKLVPELYNQANSAATQLSELPRYQSALDAAITGPFAEQRLSTAKVASALGFTGDKAVNATREVIQGLSEMALKSRTMLTGQGQITEGEQKLLIKARSGDINFTKGELKTIFDVADRAAKAQYNQSQKLLKSAAKQSPTAQMFLENMQSLPETPEQATPGTTSTGMPAGFRVIR